MKKIIILLIIFILIGALGYIAWQKMDTPGGDNPPVEITPTQTETITADKVGIETVYFNNKTGNKFVQCEYPKIISFKNAYMQNNINLEISGHIREYINEIDYKIDDQTKPEELYQYTTSYERFNYGKYLFLVISQKIETGGIRSNEWKDIYSINVETERIVYLSEMFEVGTKFEQAIIDEITKQAAERNIEINDGNGIHKIPQKQSFYIQDGKLIIYFQPSFIAAEAYGDLSFEMPFTLNSQGFFEIN